MSTPIFNAVIGTAGHIDHGKSTLVKALTGIHPDRLPEEQDKGITIDLGFAPMVLSNGMRVGIIDVPGHERFVKNMVAGATGIDFVLMVVAADDGVMAQTREHLQIVDLLGVRDGLTVVTKTDMVEPEYLELVKEDILAVEAGTMLEQKPIITVSSKTGDGIPELKALLEKTLPKVIRRTQDGPFRMPIQRVFAKEGFGTVVTGVPISGHVDIGDTLDVLPPEYHGRVKGIHAYNQAITHGQAGHSTAVNLIGPGIDKRQVERGMVAVAPGIFEPTNLITAHFVLLASSPWPLKHRAAVRFHAGTVEIQAKILLLEGDTLKPGSGSFVQVLLEEKTVLVPGDRFILRLQSPMITLGGGQTLDNVPVKRKRLDSESIDELKERLRYLTDSEQFLKVLLSRAQTPKSVRELCAETGMLPERIQTFASRSFKTVKPLRLSQQRITCRCRCSTEFRSTSLLR
jgi:selenocysteine-specific elongation factor